MLLSIHICIQFIRVNALLNWIWMLSEIVIQISSFKNRFIWQFWRHWYNVVTPYLFSSLCISPTRRPAANKNWGRATMQQQRRRKVQKSGGSIVCQIGFYADISREWRCNLEIDILAYFYRILLVFEVPYRPWVKWMPGKS